MPISLGTLDPVLHKATWYLKKIKAATSLALQIGGVDVLYWVSQGNLGHSNIFYMWNFFMEEKSE